MAEYKCKKCGTIHDLDDLFADTLWQFPESNEDEIYEDWEYRESYIWHCSGCDENIGGEHFVEVPTIALVPKVRWV